MFSGSIEKRDIQKDAENEFNQLAGGVYGSTCFLDSECSAISYCRKTSGKILEISLVELYCKSLLIKHMKYKMQNISKVIWCHCKTDIFKYLGSGVVLWSTLWVFKKTLFTTLFKELFLLNSIRSYFTFFAKFETKTLFKFALSFFLIEKSKTVTISELHTRYYNTNRHLTKNRSYYDVDWWFQVVRIIHSFVLISLSI